MKLLIGELSPKEGVGTTWVHRNLRMAYVAQVRAEHTGHFKPCMTDIYLPIDARMADYIRMQP